MTNPLASLLAQRIARSGPISVASFMAEALTHPQHGYYTTRDPFGRDGDFITAPEISQLFGEALAVWAIESWREAGRPDRIALVELGPGRGTLLADLLRAANAAPDFCAAIELHLVEASPVLRQRQGEILRDYAPVFHDTLATVPEDRPWLLVANEFFDALPIRQFVRIDGAWRERLIDRADENDGDRFRFVASRTVSPLAAAIAPAAPNDAIFELSPGGLALMATIARQIAARGVGALLIDYGRDAAFGSTLQGARAHRTVDPLSMPGDADLTSLVDFAALGRVAGEAGAIAHGPVAQAPFLLRLGIEARVTALGHKATADAIERLDSGLARITDELGMGRDFHVLAVTRSEVAPRGFA